MPSCSRSGRSPDPQEQGFTITIVKAAGLRDPGAAMPRQTKLPGSNMFRIIGHTGRRRADFAKHIASRFLLSAAAAYGLRKSCGSPDPPEQDVLQSTCAARTAYEHVKGRSVSKVDTFSFHLRRLPVLYASARHFAREGGLQNRSESYLRNRDLRWRSETEATPGFDRGGLSDEAGAGCGFGDPAEQVCMKRMLCRSC